MTVYVSPSPVTHLLLFLEGMRSFCDLWVLFRFFVLFSVIRRRIGLKFRSLILFIALCVRFPCCAGNGACEECNCEN